MIRGELSNEAPPRLIVLLDCIVKSEEVVEKKLFGRKKTSKSVELFDAPSLSLLWNKAHRYGLSVELAAFASDDWTQEHLDKVMDRLERRGGNPFNYAELYPSIEYFLQELPYRANLKGVVDTRARVARYGSWGIEIENL